MPLRAESAGRGMSDLGEAPLAGRKRPGASDDSARTSRRVPEHIRFP